MYDTVLWATDASPVAEGALPTALELLKPDGRLIAFHCDERFLSGRAGGMPLMADEQERRERLQATIQDLRADGIDAELVIETTTRSPAGEIAKAAEILGADVIVCGTRGFGIVAGAVAGSVAMRLPHLAACPVVVISEHAAQQAAQRLELAKA
jgi:nucleotide-binding universal stress UspA family protein